MTVLWKSRLRRHLRMHPTQYGWLQLGRIPKSRSSGRGFSYTLSMQMPHTTASLWALRDRELVVTWAAAAPGSAGTCKQSNALAPSLTCPEEHHRVTGSAQPQETPNPPLQGQSMLLFPKLPLWDQRSLDPVLALVAGSLQEENS